MHIGTDCRNVSQVRAMDRVGNGSDQGRHIVCVFL
jgi:hypothetical protein